MAPGGDEAPPAQAPEAWEQPPAGHGGPPPGRRSSTPTGRRPARSRLVPRLLAGFLALLLAFVAWFLVSLFQPFHGRGHGRVVVVIPAGAGVGRISSILARAKVISSGFFFQLRVTLDGKRSDLHSGRFALQQDMSYAARDRGPDGAAAAGEDHHDHDSRGFQPHADRRGRRGQGPAGELPGRLAPLGGPRPGPLRGARGHPEPRRLPVSGHLRTEGRRARSALAEEQLEAFKENVGPAIIRSAHRLHETTYQLLTVASMVEREALGPPRRPLIAAVIYNRLRAHMPLGIDATIYYAVELERHIPTYEHPLTESDLHLDSPYNTRIHTGLPPTPIANPGLESIAAAAHPARVAYLYYVEAPDGCGEQRFSTTYSEFQRNVEAYDEALARNHGHLPACRHRP